MPSSGFDNTACLLAMLQLSAAEARLRVEHAALVGTGRTLTEEVLPPRLSATAAALAAGEIGPDRRPLTNPLRR